MASINILTVNAGSSSLKASVFSVDGAANRRLLDVTVSLIGRPQATIHWKSDSSSDTQERHIADHAAAAQAMAHILEEQHLLAQVAGVGYRLVHGGPAYHQPTRLGPDVIAALESLQPLDPEHTPAALGIIKTLRAQLPHAAHVGCFDTGFFHGLPRVAKLLPIPRRYQETGVRRYGFHGLSYTYVLRRFAAVAGPEAAKGRIIMAHLGSGASLAAVHDGAPVETTMGFSPASGIMMSSRSGDLDPGVAGYLHRQAGMDFDAYDRMVNFESGLLGVSGISADMLTLLQQESSSVSAHDAIELFCYDVRKAIGSLTAVLGGLDSLIFTGGIGEPSAVIRQRVCNGLEYLGVRLDDGRNKANAERISADGARAGVHVIPTDEAFVLCRQTLQVMSKGDTDDAHD